MWSNAKCRKRKSFGTLCYIVILCQYLIKIKSNQYFFKCNSTEQLSLIILLLCIYFSRVEGPDSSSYLVSGSGVPVSTQFHLQLEFTNSHYVSDWLIFLLQKFDTSSKKRNENNKNTNFIMKNNKKLYKSLKQHFLWTCPADPWCNMLQTFERWRKHIGVTLSDEHTPRADKSPASHVI